MLKENYRMIANTEVLKKQAESASKEYIKLLKSENEKEGGEDIDLKKKLSQLKEENESLKSQTKKLIAEVSGIKSQAENQQSSYNKLLEENKSLKNKLDDFTALLGDVQKKHV